MFFRMNPFGGVIMIFSIIIGILAVVFVVKLFQNKNNTYSPEETSNKALDILKERFAKGEIDEEEFTRREKFLKK